MILLLLLSCVAVAQSTNVYSALNSLTETLSKRFPGVDTTPIIQALQLEGSPHIKPLCDSDFPTNPTCQYPKWPDHSLPPGPAKPPSPLPPADCLCGSPWVVQMANPMIAGLSESKRPSATVTTKDCTHDVSDVHPFHLPHIFNSCPPGNGTCVLNTSTVTMPIYQAGSLFPNASNPPLSAFELRTKLKSRESVWEAAGLGKQSTKVTDSNLTMCRNINQKAYDWALQNADPAVRAAFESKGEPMVMVDDKAAPIGIEGPTWIKKELEFTREGGKVQVQSWQFVVDNVNQGKDPWFFPVGMHYCKLLSPARAMEWIYTSAQA